MTEDATALHARAGAESAAGDLESAAATYAEAAALRRAAGEQGPLAHELRHFGQTLLELGRPDEAEGPLSEALALYRALGTGGVTLANALRPMALLHEAQRRPEEARRLWRQARALYAAAGIAAGVEEADDHLG